MVFIQSVFDTIVSTNRHTFQVLTKRPERALQIAGQLPWPTNLWLGVSVENDDYSYRIDLLRQIPAQTKFLSLEPLLGPMPSLNLTNIDWVITGGESGPKSRTVKPEWVTAIRDQCVEQQTPFFFKQWGGSNKKRSGRELDGTTWDQFPPDPPAHD